MLCAAALEPWARFIELWREWWLGDALGALIVAPGDSHHRPSRAPGRRRELEAIALVALTAVATQVVSGQVLAHTVRQPSARFRHLPVCHRRGCTTGSASHALVIFSAAAIIILNTLQGYRRPLVRRRFTRICCSFMYSWECWPAADLLLAAAITERRVLERRRTATYAAGSAIAGSSSVEEAAPRILGAICSNLGWRAGGLLARRPGSSTGSDAWPRGHMTGEHRDFSP